MACCFCGGQARPQNAPSTPNDRARYLAGLPVSNRSPLKEMEQYGAFAEESKFLAAQWQDVEKKRLNSLTTWSAEEVRPRINTGLPVLYMFGGPDFLNVHTIYPNAPQFILCGLEPVGKVPALERLPKEEVEQALTQLGVILEPPLRQGFFITKNMDKTLRQGEVYGVLPVLYVFLARGGNEISNVQYVKIAQTGKLSFEPEDTKTTDGIKGVKITFNAQEAAAPQELYYFKEDLSDEALNRDRRFLNYLETLRPGNTYLKAASYLMHMNTFTMIREFLLGHSASVLQDDSGIPYRYFLNPSWHVTLYGNYTKPITDFKWGDQPDLLKAYQIAGAARPMPFKTGYGTKEMANLLFAVRAAK